MSAVKHDDGKPRMELVMRPALVEIAKAMQYGAVKYADWNYLQGDGLDWLRPAGAALRHLTSWLCGEDKDPESGLSHLAHAGASVLMLLDLVLAGKGKDGRYQPTPAGHVHTLTKPCPCGVDGLFERPKTLAELLGPGDLDKHIR